MDTKMSDAEALAVLERNESWIGFATPEYDEYRAALAHLSSRLVAGEDYEAKVERVAGTLAYYHYGKPLAEMKDADAEHCYDLARAALDAAGVGNG